MTRPLTQKEVESDYERNTGEVIKECFEELDPIAVPAVLVAGHGCFTWGSDIHDAVQNAVALEAVADMALATIALHGNVQPLERFLLDKHYRRKHGKDAHYGQR